MSAYDPNELGPRPRGPGAWSHMPQRRMSVEFPHPNPAVGTLTFQSVTSEQWRELEALGRKIQGASPQVVGVGTIVAYSHIGQADGMREVIQAVAPAQLALIDAYVAGEEAAGRQPSSWLLNNQINRARIG
jgi:hypothetical protein